MKKTCSNCWYGRKAKYPSKRHCKILNVETNADRDRRSCKHYREMSLGLKDYHRDPGYGSFSFGLFGGRK